MTTLLLAIVSYRYRLRVTKIVHLVHVLVHVFSSYVADKVKNLEL